MLKLIDRKGNEFIDKSQAVDEKLDLSQLLEDVHSQPAELPNSTRMCVFQLAESTDINRITKILEFLAKEKSSPDSICHMVQRYNL